MLDETLVEMGDEEFWWCFVPLIIETVAMIWYVSCVFLIRGRWRRYSTVLSTGVQDRWSCTTLILNATLDS